MTESTIMEKQLNFAQKLSLEDMALRRVVVNFWNAADILASFENFRLEWLSAQRKEGICRPTVETKIKAKVSRLLLPQSLKERIMHFVTPIGVDIIEWKLFHEKIFSTSNKYFDVSFLKYLCWTCSGAVDYKETAEKLARVETLDVVKRYKLACLYCLADYIPDLWRELPEEVKREHSWKTVRDPMLDRNAHLENYWAHCLLGKEFEKEDINSTYLKQITFIKDAFESAACTGNKAATKYFFQKLTNERLDSILFRTVHLLIAERHGNPLSKRLHFPKKKYSEVLWYLLCLMRPEHQMQVLKERPGAVLTCFLDWPLQDFFLDVADFIWTFLPVSQYSDLPSCFTNKLSVSRYYFPNLILDFFLRGPRDFREHFVRQPEFVQFEFVREDAGTLKVVFKNVDLGDTLPLDSKHWFVKLLMCLVMSDDWYLTELCIREASLSKENTENLKEAFKTLNPDFCPLNLPVVVDSQTVGRRRRWERFCKILGETEASELRK